MVARRLAVPFRCQEGGNGLVPSMLLEVRRCLACAFM
jgi:hypothetical protein